MKRSLLQQVTRLALGSALALGAALPARGADNDDTRPTEDRWHVTLAPYAFGASLDGKAVVRGLEADVDLSSRDILDHLDSAFMGIAAVRKRDWGLLADTVQVNLSVESDRPPAKLEPSLGITTVSAVRRLADFADLTAGARWTHLEGSIELQGLLLRGKAERTRDWVDPVVGVVLRTPTTEQRWHASLIADVGGFGVGSDLTYQVFPSVGFRLTDHVSVEAGWRILYADYATGRGRGRFESDVALQGPVSGIVFSF